jgi:HEPN domain-containing protein
MPRSDRQPEYWFDLARDDMRGAEILAREAGPLDIAGYHYHQALEKTLKNLLMKAKVEIPRIHDVERLFRMLPDPIREKAQAVPESISFTNSFYSSFRYPHGDRLSNSDLDRIRPLSHPFLKLWVIR